MKELISKLPVFLISPFLLVGAAFDCDAQTDERQKLTAAQNYLNYCAGCHGYKLEKFEKKDWMYGEDMQRVVRTITSGQADNGMPAFEVTFTNDEIEELAAYVKAGLPKNKEVLKPALSSNNSVESEVQSFIVDTVVSGLSVRISSKW